MLGIDSFVRICAGHIEKGEPFIAYHHPNGFGLLRTGIVQVEEWDVYIFDAADLDVYKHHAATAEERDNIMYRARRRGDRVDRIETVYKEKKVKKGTVSKARKIITQLRKDRRCWPLYVVEFDGAGLTTEGGPELDALQTIPIGGGAGNA